MAKKTSQTVALKGRIQVRNYRSIVSALRSVEQIEALLVSAGARDIARRYGPQGNIESISFILETEGMKLAFRIMPNLTGAWQWLKSHSPRSKADMAVLEQAERMAWKQLLELVHLQLSARELELMESITLLLPYLYDPVTQRSYYQMLKEGGFKALLPA